MSTERNRGVLIAFLRQYYAMRFFYRFIIAWAVTAPVALLIVWAVQRG